MSIFMYTINIKNKFKDHPTNKDVSEIAQTTIKELKYVNARAERKVEKMADGFVKENLTYCIDQLSEIIEQFEWIVENATKNEDDLHDIGFTSWNEAYNEYLGQLYTIGDTLIKKDPNNWTKDKKFLWVG